MTSEQIHLSLAMNMLMVVENDDLSLTPAFEASILYVEVLERTINLVNGKNTYSQNFNFYAFAEDIFRKGYWKVR